MFEYQKASRLGTRGKLLILVVASLIFFPWKGYVFSVLWGWFVVPVFDLPIITWQEALGIFLMAALLNLKYEDDADESDELFFKKIFTQFVGPLVFFGIGWAVMLINGRL